MGAGDAPGRGYREVVSHQLEPIPGPGDEDLRAFDGDDDEPPAASATAAQIVAAAEPDAFRSLVLVATWAAARDTLDGEAIARAVAAGSFQYPCMTR